MAIDFEDTNNNYIEIGDVTALDLTGDEISLSAWIKVESFDGEMKFVAKWSDAGGAFQYLLSVTSSNIVQFVVHAGGSNEILTGTTTLVTGVWYHVGGTYDGSTMRLYLDGVEENSTSKTGNMTNTSAPVRIGAGSGGAGTEQPFDGLIADARVYDRGLSAAEIQTIYTSQGADGIVFGLAGRWVMNEKAPGIAASGVDSIKDASEGGSDGTPVGSPLYELSILKSSRRRVA